MNFLDEPVKKIDQICQQELSRWKYLNFLELWHPVHTQIYLKVMFVWSLNKFFVRNVTLKTSYISSKIFFFFWSCVKQFLFKLYWNILNIIDRPSVYNKAKFKWFFYLQLRLSFWIIRRFSSIFLSVVKVFYLVIYFSHDYFNRVTKFPI